MHIPTDREERPRQGGKLAVLGGCGGIGRALVGAALRRGLDVAVLDLPASLQRYSAPDGVLSCPVDASDEAQLDAAFGSLTEAWGKLDGFVNLCGFWGDASPVDATPAAAWRSVVDGNLNAAFLAAARAIPLLQRGQGASLVQVASGLAYYGRPGYGAYSAAKAGMASLTRTLAVENAPEIRVNTVAPSAVDTAFLRGGTGRSDEAGAVPLDLEAYAASIPLGRVAEADDVIGPILFLLGDQSRYVTGQVLHVNGGAFTY